MIVFESFMEVMGPLNTVITDEQVEIKSALARMTEIDAFQGIHLFDIYHVMKNLRKNVRNPQLWRLASEILLE